MTKNVKVTINLNVARSMLGLAGFWDLAQTGTDDEIFAQVLDMMTCYGAKTEIVEDCVSPDAASLLTTMAMLATDVQSPVVEGGVGYFSMFSEFDESICNDEIAF